MNTDNKNSVGVLFIGHQLTAKLQDYAFKHCEGLRDAGLITDRQAIAICVLAAEKLLESLKGAAEYVNVDYRAE